MIPFSHCLYLNNCRLFFGPFFSSQLFQGFTSLKVHVITNPAFPKPIKWNKLQIMTLACKAYVHGFQWHLSENTAFCVSPVSFQVFGHEPYTDPRGLHHRRPASVQPAAGPVCWPEEAVPALPGPHAVHRRRCQDGDPRVPVPVQTSTLELQHRGQLLCFWTCHADR